MAMRASAAALGLLAALACGGEEPAVETTDASQPEAPAAEEAHAGNRAPVIQGVALTPDHPRPGDQIVAQVSASDPDGDEVALEYRWTVGGEQVDESSSILDLEDVERGGAIEVAVIASDGERSSAASRASVKVGNQPPAVTGVALEPAAGLQIGRDLVATPTGEDPDGDRLQFSYHWIVDGEELEDDEPTLRGDRFERGDAIVLEVVANDGSDDSEVFRSEPVEVANAAPRITSTPGAIGKDGVFRYEVVADDPDGDTAFRYRLVTAPPGMTIGFDDGRVDWKPGKASEGSHEVEVEVTDLFGGRATQPFEIRLSYSDEKTPPASASDDDSDTASDEDAEVDSDQDSDDEAAADDEAEADTADEGEEG